MTLGGTVHGTSPGLQDTSRTQEVFLSGTTKKGGFHIRRDPAFRGPPQRHDRQPHRNVCSAHERHAADDAPGALQGGYEERLQQGFDSRQVGWA